MSKKHLNHLRIVTLAACVALLSAGCPQDCVDEIRFVDQNLEIAVREDLDLPFGCINQEKMLEVTNVQAESYGIRDLRGIEAAINIEELNLKTNNILSIQELRNLVNLRHLDLSFNDVKNLEPLSGLFNLKVLDLTGNNHIKDWSPLAANVGNGGFSENGIIIVDQQAATAVGSGELLPNFIETANSILAANPNVTILLGVPIGGDGN